MDKVFSPVKGICVEKANINDMVFSEGMIGVTVGIKPEEGVVKAPFDGKVIMVYPSNHAIGLLSNDGIELLIHIGLETVMLNGKYFNRIVENESIIKKGDILIEFDLESIIKEGYDPIIPTIITNCFNEEDITINYGQVTNDDIIFEGN